MDYEPPSYQPPREQGLANTAFNWHFFAPSKTTDGTTQYTISQPPNHTQMIGKTFYWYSFSENYYRIKY